MHHGAAIFAKKKIGFIDVIPILAKVWRQSANITF